MMNRIQSILHTEMMLTRKLLFRFFSLKGNKTLTFDFCFFIVAVFLSTWWLTHHRLCNALWVTNGGTVMKLTVVAPVWQLSSFSKVTHSFPHFRYDCYHFLSFFSVSKLVQTNLMTVLRNTRLFEIIQLRCSSLLNYHLSGLTTIHNN